jgi:hypothetical protein
MEQALPVLALLVGCADAPAPPSPAPMSAVVSNEPSPRPPASAAPAVEKIAIRGRLTTSRGTPLAGEPFVTVDLDGERSEAVTGPSGELEVEELRPPYDLRVGDTVYLAVTRPDPVLEVDREEERAPPEEVVVEVHPPSCGRGPCIIDVVTTSRDGEGRATAVGEGPVAVSHIFRGRDASEVTAHVLAHDEDFASVAYARGHGTLWPTRVETNEVAADDASVRLDVPGGASFEVRKRVPWIPGATWRMERSAAAPPTAMVLHRSSRAWSGILALGRDPPALPLPVGPEILRPVAGGALSARGAGWSWASDPRALFTIDVVDVARGAFCYRVLTNDGDLPPRRLEALGLARLSPGAHTFSLETSPFTSVDDAVSSDAATRRRRFDMKRAGAATYETIAFTVSR